MKAKLVKEFLNEDVIQKDKFNLEIDFGVSRTQHASERQSRHEKGYISNEEITANVKGAMEPMLDDLIFDRIGIGERVIIKNLDSHLNIVGIPKAGPSNTMMFKLITVMREPNFRNIKNTRTIKIRNEDLNESLNENRSNAAIYFAREMEKMEDKLIKSNRSAWSAYEKETGDFWEEIGASNWSDVYLNDVIGAFAFKDKLESLINM